MAGKHGSPARVALAVLVLVLLLLVVWDITGSDSIIRGLFDAGPSGPADNAERIFETTRPSR